MNGRTIIWTHFVLLVLLLVSMVMVPLVSANEEIMRTELDSGPSQQEIDSICVLLMDDIKISDINKDLKNELLQSLNEVRKNNLPVVEKLAVINRVGKILLNSNSSSNGVKWSGYIDGGDAPHNDMARLAGERCNLNPEACTILYERAADPDTWEYSWNHYATTGAPGEAEKYAKFAIGYLNDDDPSNDDYAYENLAYSLHFMTDMSQPFHYNVEYLANHAAYETYTLENWKEGKDFLSDVELTWSHHYITDVSDSASDLASSSYQCIEYIRKTMDKYSNWGDDPTLIQYTRDCFVEGAKYNMGLIDYVKRH